MKYYVVPNARSYLPDAKLSPLVACYEIIAPPTLKTTFEGSVLKNKLHAKEEKELRRPGQAAVSDESQSKRNYSAGIC